MKKTIALFLALVMLLGMAACGQAPAEDPKDTTPPAPTTEFVAPTQPVDTNPALGTLPLTEEDVTLTIGLIQSANTEDYETNEYTKWLEEQTGIKLDFVYFQSGEAVSQLNLMIAGGEELPDILWNITDVDTALMYELGEDGYLVDIKEYFNEYGYWFWDSYNQVVAGDQGKIFQFGISPIDGGLYAFPGYEQSATDSCNTLTAINTKWLEAIGEDVPTTVDELYTVLKKFATEDPNGNGKADEMPVVGAVNGYRTDIISFIINAFVYCSDKYVFNATDGQIWEPYTTDEYRQALVYLNKLYEEGLISPLVYTITEDAEIAALMTPADGVAVAGLGGAHPSLHYAKDSEVMYEYTPLKPLEGATELGGYAAQRGSKYLYNTFITTDCEDPVLAFKLLDFMSGSESYWRQRYGVYGVDWEYAAEGTVSNLGYPARVKMLDSTVYANQNNKLWHLTYALVPQAIFASEYTNDGSWTARRINLSATNFSNYVNGAHPAEVIEMLLYSAEEQEYVSSVESQITSYVAEARAMFVSGAMDPNDDAQWNNYLANLEAQGLSKWVEIAQDAYSRMLAG